MMLRSFNGYLFALPPIETRRLLLRKITMADAKDIFAYSRDEEVARHVLWEAQRSLREAREYVRYLQRLYRSDQPASWGIVDKASGRLIGTVGFMNYNADHNSAEIGYSLARDYWNRGLMTEAVRAVLRHAFEEMHLHRVEAQFELDNPASGRVMEKAGMMREGVLRGRLYNKGRYVDVVLYAVLREDYMSKLHGGNA